MKNRIFCYFVDSHDQKTSFHPPPDMPSHIGNDFSETLHALKSRLHYVYRAKHSTGFSHEFLTLLERYTWPGNIRQLRHEIERLVAITPEGERATLDHCPHEILNFFADPDADQVEGASGSTLPEHKSERFAFGYVLYWLARSDTFQTGCTLRGRRFFRNFYFSET